MACMSASGDELVGMQESLQDMLATLPVHAPTRPPDEDSATSDWAITRIPSRKENKKKRKHTGSVPSQGQIAATLRDLTAAADNKLSDS